MKKYLYLLTSLTMILSLTNCNIFSKKYNNDHLSFITLKPCLKRPFDTNVSFICLKAHKSSDLVETNIKFDADSFTLNDQSKEVLDKLYAYIVLTRNSNFAIRGYAGRIDSKLIKDVSLLTEHNLYLSKNRAISVRDYLFNRGLDYKNITIKALGYQDPIAPNDSGAHRAFNQRVEITLRKQTFRTNK